MSTATLNRQEIRVLTRNEADLIVRNTVGNIYDQEGYEWVEPTTVAWQLSYFLNAPVSADYVEDMVSALRDLEQIEDGSHEELKVSGDLTENNKPYLLAYYEGNLNVAVNSVLDGASFPGNWIIRYSE